MSSQIFAIPSNGDKTLILDTRASFLQPFKAINWTDLRLTFAASLTAAAANDQQSGLSEVYPSTGDINHAYLGFKSSDALIPTQTNFWGISSNQILVPSAQAQLQDNAGSWQLGNTNSVAAAMLVSNGTTKQNSGIGQAVQPLFYEGASPATLYANVFILRMRRNDPTLPIINTLEAALFPSGFVVGSYNGLTGLVSDTTIATLRATTAAAVFTTLITPFTFVNVPDAIYFFWPFANSRLRIHSYVLEKYA